MNPYRLRAYLYLIIVAAIWGIATPVIKYTLAGIDPLPFLTYRFGIAAAFAIVFIVITKASLTHIKKNLGLVLTYSILTTTLALGILFLGIDRTTVIDTALITAVGPLVTALAGVYFLKEHVTKQERIGISIALLGTLVVVFGPVMMGNGDLKLTGNLLVLGYIIIMAFSSVLSKKLVRKKVDPLTLTNVSFIIGFATILPIAILVLGTNNLTSAIFNLESNYQLGVWYMALISGTLAYSLWVRGQKTIEISEAGVFSYLIPIFAAPLGIIWLGESITTPFILGAILITIGVIIAEYKRRNKASSP